MNRVLRTAALALGVAAVGVLAHAAPASAHVTVSAQDPTQGGYARVAFRVPTESDTASTTKLEVHLPAATPIASVSTMPVPGWTVAVAKAKLAQPIKVHDSEITEAVSVITWTAGPNAAVKPGEFQEFPVSLGPLPNVDQLVFKALQTYSDGNIVRWIEEPVAGGAEPANPAPVLKLLPASSGESAAPAPATSSDDSSGNGTAVGLGVAGLVAGLAGLALGALAFARTRRTPAPASPAPSDKAAVS